MSRLPARGYSWPPFEKGNTAALKEGAYSPSVIEAEIPKWKAWLLETAPALDDPRWSIRVHNLAFELTRLHRFQVVAMKADVVQVKDEQIVARESINKMLNAVGRRVDELMRELPIEPHVQARIQGEMANAALSTIDLQREQALGRRLVIEAEQRRLEHKPEPKPEPDPDPQPKGKEDA